MAVRSPSRLAGQPIDRRASIIFRREAGAVDLAAVREVRIAGCRQGLMLSYCEPEEGSPAK